MTSVPYSKSPTASKMLLTRKRYITAGIQIIDAPITGSNDRTNVSTLPEDDVVESKEKECDNCQYSLHSSNDDIADYGRPQEVVNTLHQFVHYLWFKRGSIPEPGYEFVAIP